ncbi:MAG: phenylacetate-CoA oxygenase subunit PaaJ [Bacteroidetes bacterium]|jgi:ring-1,2-phenylacetyl-CoA epoxidase subunit PaaD|nr:phenylacetate-CoA oxygenase subunit PaaJ [Bacteroidota bacterium]
MVTDTIQEIIRRLHDVMDPEIPFLNVMEMGMVREVVQEGSTIVIRITPTYSGCPATDVIADDVLAAAKIIHPDSRTEIILSPAWTTDWIGEEARLKMAEHGIAPPTGQSADKAFLLGKDRITPCPLCKSTDTHMVSAFGSTACKAHFKCNACLEPFDHFKCI